MRPPTSPGRSGGSSVSRLRRISSRHSASPRSWTSSPQGMGGNGKIGIGPDNLFIHMTGQSDMGWKAVQKAGAQVSIAFPIEMNMRHGIPPIIKMQQLAMAAGKPFEPSLSVDVECTMTADFFTQMRVAMNMQRMVVNQMIFDQEHETTSKPNRLIGGFHRHSGNQWPTPTAAAAPADHARRAALRHHERCQGVAARRQGRFAHDRARKPTSSFSTPPRSTWRRSTRCPARSSR